MPARQAPVADYRGLTAAQQAEPMSIAGDTWKFYRAYRPGHQPPMDNRAETHRNTNPGEHSLVEVYRLSGVGVDQADRL